MKKQQNLRQQAYEFIQTEILTGRLAAGSQVSELTLAAKIGISRTPVREAIRQLELEGLVEQVARFGTIVRSPNRRDIIELYELREAMESYAVAQAARKISAGELVLLGKLCAELQLLSQELSTSSMAALDEAMMRRFLAADMGFHMRMLQAAGNQRIMKAVAESRVLTRIFGTRRQAQHDLSVVQETYAFHERILAALRAADSEKARTLMAEHLQASCAHALRQFDAAQNGTDAGPTSLPMGMPADLIEELRRIEQLAAPAEGEPSSGERAR
jgi:DNA-binding GntR family transcriptional regulator